MQVSGNAFLKAIALLRKDILARTRLFSRAGILILCLTLMWVSTAEAGTAPLPTVKISANPIVVVGGGTTTLNWSSENATSCKRTSVSGRWSNSPVSGSGTTSRITKTTTFKIQCTGAGGTTTWTVTVAVTKKDSSSISANISATKSSLEIGESTDISWSSQNAIGCLVKRKVGSTSTIFNAANPTDNNTSGIGTVTPGTTGTNVFTLSCTGPGGTVATSTVSVEVTAGLSASIKAVLTAQKNNLADQSADQGTTYLWLALNGDNSVAKIDPSNGGTIAKYSVGTYPSAVVHDPNQNAVWVVNSGSNNVTKLDAADGHLIGTYPVGNSPYSLVYDPTQKAIWVANNSSMFVTKLDAADGHLIGSYEVGPTSYGIAYDPTQNAIWLIHTSSKTLTKINAVTGALIGNYELGVSPYGGIAYDPVRNAVWVGGGYSSNTVVKVNATNGSVMGSYEVGTNPVALAIEPSQNTVWIANWGSDNVTKLNTVDGSSHGSFQAGLNPNGIISDGRGFIYVVNNTSHTIMKFNGNNTILSNFDVGANPRGIAIQIGNSTPPPVLRATIAASDTTITSGQSVVISWGSTADVVSCTASGGWSGTKSKSGTFTVSPTATTTYSISCTNGTTTSAVESVTVTVTGGSACALSFKRGHLDSNGNDDHTEDYNRIPGNSTKTWKATGCPAGTTYKAIWTTSTPSAACGDSSEHAWQDDTFNAHPSGGTSTYFTPDIPAGKALDGCTRTIIYRAYNPQGAVIASASSEVARLSYKGTLTSVVNSSLSASTTTIQSGWSFSLYWDSTGANACTLRLDGQSSPPPPDLASGRTNGSASVTVTLPGNQSIRKNYVLNCSSATNSATPKTVSITVNP